MITPRKTPREKLDFYPTPPEATAAVRDWLGVQRDRPVFDDEFLDPAGGCGAIVEAMRSRWGEAFWHAIEIDHGRFQTLEQCVDNAINGDALTTEWPAAHVIMNPPFSLLDDFWQRAVEHRAKHNAWCAVFTPVAWWNAEKRAGYVRPDYILALGWRPVFRNKAGPAHKGSQDFCWSVLCPTPHSETIWLRVEKPSLADHVQEEARRS